jgi:hypothetical protein
MKTSVSIVGLQAEIWSQDLPNMKQEHEPLDHNIRSTVSGVVACVTMSTTYYSIQHTQELNQGPCGQKLAFDRFSYDKAKEWCG